MCEGDNSHCRTVKLTLTKTPKKNGNEAPAELGKSLPDECLCMMAAVTSAPNHWSRLRPHVRSLLCLKKATLSSNKGDDFCPKIWPVSQIRTKCLLLSPPAPTALSPFVILGMLKMFDIPTGARHIVIEENETSPHIIGECVSHPFPADGTGSLQKSCRSPPYSCSCDCKNRLISAVQSTGRPNSTSVTHK